MLPYDTLCHPVQRSNRLHYRELWELHCCRSVWEACSYRTFSNRRRSSQLWLFFFSLSFCYSLSPSTLVVSSPTSFPSSEKHSPPMKKKKETPVTEITIRSSIKHKHETVKKFLDRIIKKRWRLTKNDGVWRSWIQFIKNSAKKNFGLIDFGYDLI